MRRRFSPRSRSFRIVLGMALLAWTMLATSAFAGSLQGFNAPGDATAMQMAVPPAPALGPDGMPIQHATRHHAPAMPMGHGDCCRGGCHCLSACNAVLAVPRLTVSVPLLHSAAPIIVPVGSAQDSVAPPLRPPIA